MNGNDQAECLTHSGRLIHGACYLYSGIFLNNNNNNTGLLMYMLLVFHVEETWCLELKEWEESRYSQESISKEETLIYLI